MDKILSKNKGSILMEAMVAMAIFVVGMSFVLLLFVSSSKGAIYSLEGTKASLISTQSMEAMRSILNDRGWLPVGTYEVGLKGDKEWDIISTEGLVGHWKLSGDARDYSGNGNDGTLIGGVTWAEDRMGQARGAGDFDGVDDYINLPVTGIYSSFSQSAWIKTDVVSTNEDIRHYILTVQKDPPNSGYYTYQQRQGFFIAGNFIYAQYWNGSGNTTLKSDVGSISAGIWYRIDFIGDNNGTKLYINGSLVDSSDIAPSDNIIATESFIGRRGDSQGEDLFDGLIDDVRIYNRALSEAEIQKLYNETENITDGLVGHWEMDETFGDLAVDSSGNNNHGTIYGAKRGGSKGRYVGIEAFTTVGSHTWTVPEGVSEVDVLVVGGGGGGGSNYGGGGGAGGLIFEENYGVSGDISVEIGDGGAGSATTSVAATNGGNSIFGSLTAIGGGKGGNGAQTTTALGNGGDGGSGGGGGGHSDVDPYVLGGVGTTNQGNDGGDGYSGSTTTERSGGGGGGANQVGSNSAPQQGGAGGVGSYLGNIFGDNYGENGWFAGGGGGGVVEVGSGGLGGVGGGGDGGHGVAGENALANTGGGGGAGGIELIGGNGGSGIVIIRYTKWVDGRHDKSLDFDGVGNYIDCGNINEPIEGKNNFSIGYWINLEQNKNYNTHMGTVAGSDYNLGWNVLSTVDGSLFFVADDTAGSPWGIAWDTGYNLTTNEWVHIVFTRDGDVFKLYINGSYYGTTTNSLTIGSGAYNLQIGSSGDERYVDGQIDDVRIYNRALTEDEIKFLYQRGLEYHVNR
jgi:hypothetical protein